MQNWEEILFHDRNKSYGSYQLRKKYAKYLFLGFLIAILLITIPIGIVYIESQKTEDYSNLPYIVSVELDKPPDLEASFSPPPMEQKQDAQTHEYVPVIVDTVKPETQMKNEAKETKDTDNDSTALAKNGNSTRGNGFDINSDSAIFYLNIDNVPEFPGGKRALIGFISQNTVYPELAQKQNIEGKVIVLFTVTRDGDVSNISIKKSTNPIFDREALRIVKMFPKWKPAKRKGMPIPYKYVLPMVFKINYKGSGA
jgi:protein TonB